MKPETKTIIQLAGMGLGAVCAGPLGTCAGGLIGGVLGIGLTEAFGALGTGAGGVLTNLFSSRVEKSWGERPDSFNHDFRRSLARALRSLLGAETVATPTG